MRKRRSKNSRLLYVVIFLFSFCNSRAQQLQLSRSAQLWEFLCAVGTEAGLFGNESGQLEAWVYPLKIFRNFHLRFLTEGRSLPAGSLVRTVTVRPESSTIIYAGDTFQVTETLIVPVRQPGAIIRFEVETAHPLEIEAEFQPDFQLEWPAALGGTYSNWEPATRAFYFGEEQRKYSAFLGSPTGELAGQEYETNYSSSERSAIRLGSTTKGRETKLVVLAASVHGRTEAASTYKRLLVDYAALERESARYYSDYLAHTVQLDLPDARLQQAYDWARVSVAQGLVTNPYLGTGLVAGYRTSGNTQRPGFAWYFGRDSFWTALALDAEGDFATTRIALDFISKYQRADGKIPHEISQGASFVDWFNAYPYPYASVDATPLYLIAAGDYVTQSGDRGFAREKWESLWKAYQFLKSTYDSQGLPQNFGFGHGWVEGGPLLPVKTELYQSSVGAEALAALSSLAHFAGKDDICRQLADEFSKQKERVNRAFWSDASQTYAFALDKNDQQVIEPSVLATVPMWFGLLDSTNSEKMIDQLAAPEHQSDWGMRIISAQASRYDAGGYHYGSVWPLFTGWASVGEYRYHRPLPAYLNLQANAQLALDGSLGHVTEVLSGDYYQPLSTSSPHQIWSSAMVISPILRGLLGLETSAANHHVTFAPHIPAQWDHVAVRQVRAGDMIADFTVQRKVGEILLAIESKGNIDLNFAPALSPRAEVLGAELNGRRVPFRTDTNASDQHVMVQVQLQSGPNQLKIRVRNDFAVGVPPSLPALGSRSKGIRVISENWSASREALTLEVMGVVGASYELPLWNAEQVSSVEGATLHNGKLMVQIPASDTESYPRTEVILHFPGRR